MVIITYMHTAKSEENSELREERKNGRLIRNETEEDYEIESWEEETSNSKDAEQDPLPFRNQVHHDSIPTQHSRVNTHFRLVNSGICTSLSRL